MCYRQTAKAFPHRGGASRLPSQQDETGPMLTRNGKERDRAQLRWRDFARQIGKGRCLDRIRFLGLSLLEIDQNQSLAITRAHSGRICLCLRRQNTPLCRALDEGRRAIRKASRSTGAAPRACNPARPDYSAPIACCESRFGRIVAFLSYWINCSIAPH